MTERSVGQKRASWTVRFAAAVVLAAMGVGLRGVSSPRCALAREPAQEAKVSPKAQRLPDDLVDVSDAKYASLEGLAPGSREAQERQREVVQRLGLPLEVRTRKTGIVFRLIPPGTFTMGSPSSESGRGSDETQHQVTLTNAFYCGKVEVTQGQWQQVMGSNPSYFTGGGKDAPVEQVSWEDCRAFVRMLCRVEGVPQETYRLLTEAEWEYACRAGTTGPYAGDLALMGWYASSSTHPVGEKAGNGFGLYDMHGNVWEWCQDPYGDIYEQAVVKTVAGFFRGNPKHLFGVTRFGAPGSYVRGRLQSP